MTIDHDGNGEVDFEEFLSLMTNTDIFIQAVEGGTVNEAEIDSYKKRGKFLNPINSTNFSFQ